ncbi:MAG: SMP-30/gluconolactonase/LRE family protein [Hyphomonadaceae bacterium]|nr:SMP-30/gluconolactonase/LRE family protein [Hyphomonadaceae bacterium]
MQQVAGGFGLVEAPVWDAARGLNFSDVTNGGVFLLSREGELTNVLAKRRGIGGMALHTEGGLVMSGRDISHYIPHTGGGAILLSPKDLPEALGFNDLTTDREGRVYVGSLGYRVFGGDPPKPGHLHVVDLDGSVRTLSDGIMLTNGMAFSPDGRTLYHADAGRELVRAYEVSGDGSVGPWRAFAALGAHSLPDGLKVAQDGSVWVADAHHGRVVVYAADGSHLQDLPVPLPMVTSLCFGGDDLRDLYVVTGSEGGPSVNCGSVFRTRVDVAGLPISPARVKL